MAYVLGVDLGSTTVAAAAGDADRAEAVTLGDATLLTPAAVARRGDGALITGDAALRRAVADPERVARGIRRRLGDPTPFLLGGEGVSPTDLLGALLRGAVERTVAARGGRPDRVVLTHPASWGPYRRGLVEDVAAAAGLPDVLTVTDPVAAVRQVDVVRGLPDGPVAVLDVGGTSCEATVVSGGAVVGVPVAVERLGGDDLDEALAAVVDEAAGGPLAELDPEDPSSGPALARFRADCVAAKEALSTDTEVRVPLLLPGRHADVTVRRTAFEQRIAPVVERAVAALRQALEAAASADAAGPVAVLLVGGSARVPLLVRAVRTAVAAPVVVEARPDHVVALGAVRLGAARPAPSAGRSGTAVEDGRTTLTPLRPANEDARTTAVRVAPRTAPDRPAGPARPGLGTDSFRAPGPPGSPGGPARPHLPATFPAGPRPPAPPPGPPRPPVPPRAPAPTPTGRRRTVLRVLVVLLIVAALAAGLVLLLGG
ncbi:Hsp70 family protein [Actinomycetospora sp. NBRC 106378]|uniref:Hsp70 family protein n=1 Tax=Actinomycetospora sp. NBRC 106378 TaxID=3032208 RepID=UPI002555D352|nr:Hsp70 family protein [Actinomycetospora sp. NBRC 106378]